MKKIFYLLLTVLPQICFAQILSYSDSSSLSWQYVGNPDFSTDTVAFPSLAITSGEVPYIAFQEYAYSVTIQLKNDLITRKFVKE